MSTSSRDETAEPGPSDRDLTKDGTGRLGLTFNNPYLQRVCVDGIVSCVVVVVGHSSRLFYDRFLIRVPWAWRMGKSNNP